MANLFLTLRDNDALPQPTVDRILKMHRLRIAAEDISDTLQVGLDKILGVLASSNDSQLADNFIQKFDRKSRRLRCTISKNLMKSPVLAPDGQFYEQSILVASIHAKNSRVQLDRVIQVPSLINEIRHFALKTLKKLQSILVQPTIPDSIACIAAECLSVLDFEAEQATYLTALTTNHEAYLLKLLNKLSDLISPDEMSTLLVQCSQKESLQIASILIIRNLMDSRVPPSIDSELDLLLGVLSQANLKPETLKHLDELTISKSQLWSVIGALCFHQRDEATQAKINELKTRVSTSEIRKEVVKSQAPNDARQIKIDLANDFYAQGTNACNEANYVKAEEMYLKCLAIREEILPPNHPDLASIYNDLGIQYKLRGSYAKAEKMCLKCLHIWEEVLPPMHPDLASIYRNLGAVKKAQGNDSQAQELYLKCLRIREEVLSPNHPDLAAILSDLGILYKLLGSKAQAQQMLIKCLHIQQELLPPSHPDLERTIRILENLKRG